MCKDIHPSKQRTLKYYEDEEDEEDWDKNVKILKIKIYFNFKIYYDQNKIKIRWKSVKKKV